MGVSANSMSSLREENRYLRKRLVDQNSLQRELSEKKRELRELRKRFNTMSERQDKIKNDLKEVRLQARTDRQKYNEIIYFRDMWKSKFINLRDSLRNLL